MHIATLSFAVMVGGFGGVQPDRQGQSGADAEKKPTRAQLSLVDPSSKEAMEAILLEIAKEYKTYARVSDRANWAPLDCRMPPPDGVQQSASKDEGTHGKKLYFLFARDEKDYNAVGWNTIVTNEDRKPFVAALGQVIVKESFKPALVKDLTTIPMPKPDVNDPNRGLVPQRELPDDHLMTDGGEVFKTGDPAGLFIMAKLAEKEKAGTDAGWVYATISADLKQVTGLGRMESCMGCHVKTEHDRLFGPKWLQEHGARKSKETSAPAAELKPAGSEKPGK